MSTFDGLHRSAATRIVHSPSAAAVPAVAAAAPAAAFEAEKRGIAAGNSKIADSVVAQNPEQCLCRVLRIYFVLKLCLVCNVKKITK